MYSKLNIVCPLTSQLHGSSLRPICDTQSQGVKGLLLHLVTPQDVTTCWWALWIAAEEEDWLRCGRGTGIRFSRSHSDKRKSGSFPAELHYIISYIVPAASTLSQAESRLITTPTKQCRQNQNLLTGWWNWETKFQTVENNFLFGGKNQKTIKVYSPHAGSWTWPIWPKCDLFLPGYWKY